MKDEASYVCESCGPGWLGGSLFPDGSSGIPLAPVVPGLAVPLPFPTFPRGNRHGSSDGASL